MKSSTFAALLMITAVTFAGTPFEHSVTLPSDSSGPFFLPDFFYTNNRITVKTLDSLILPPYRFYTEESSVRFESSVPRGTVLIFSGETEYGRLKRKYCSYLPIPYDSSAENLPKSAPNHTPTSSGTIAVSGEKSVGIALGKGGEFSMDQSLDVTMFGKISDSAVLSASITDQSTSLQGDTKEIGEIDRVFLTVKHPRRDITAGDLLIRSDSTGLIRENKVSKGIAGGFTTAAGEIRGFAGISGHKTAVEQLTGISGVQSGSYKLKGNGEPGQILPAEGTVELTVQGKKLTEGTDFTIDYTIGQILFKPVFTVLDGDIIEIRYRYREYNFSRLSGGTSYRFRKDSLFTLSGSLFGDRDYQSEKFSDTDIQTFKQSGDSIPKMLSGRKIHPNDVSRESARNRIYSFDSASHSYRWEPLPTVKAAVQDLYLVTFSADTNGDYLPFTRENRPRLLPYCTSEFLDSAERNSADSAFMKPICIYVGKGNGTLTAFTAGTAPTQFVQGEIISRFSPSPQFFIETAAAGKSRDRNRLSNLHDADNRSGGFAGKVHISTPVDNLLKLSGDGDFSYAGSQFSAQGTNRFTQMQKWGLPADSSSVSSAEGSITAEASAVGSITVGTGHARVDNSPFSTIVSTALTLIPEQAVSPSYKLLYRTSPSFTAQPGRRQETAVRFRFPAIESQLRFEEEYLSQSAQHSRGYIRGTAEAEFPRLGWKHIIEQKQNTAGTGRHIDAQKLSSYSLWKQTFTKRISDAHSLRGNTSLLRTAGTDHDGISVLAHCTKESRYLAGRIASELNYTINSENSTARKWQYLYVGEGVGTHLKDSLTGEFIPSPFGDYRAEEIILWADGTKRTVQNSFAYRWSWKNSSKNRKSDGVSLEGGFASQEDILPAGIVPALIPVLTSIQKKEGTLPYSQISLSHSVRWNPVLIPNFSSSLSAVLSQKKDLEISIRKLEPSLTIRNQFSRMTSVNTLRGILEQRNSMMIRDGSAEPRQEFPIRSVIVPFIEEIGGAVSLNDSSGWYAALRPGVRFTPKEFGTAELSYTAAHLVYRGPIFYPMAKEFTPGFSQRLFLTLSLTTKKYLRFSGFFRADYSELQEWRAAASLKASVLF